MSEIKDQLKEAEERLSTAKLLHEEGRYKDTVSRAYYSMLHSAKAILLTKDSRPKTHAGIASELGKLFGKELGSKLTSKFVTIQQLREDADYGLGTDIDIERANEAVKTAEKFLSEARKMTQDPENSAQNT